MDLTILDGELTGDLFEGDEETVRTALAAGDVVITRQNTIDVDTYTDHTLATAADPIRNGQRWEVLAVDTDKGRIAARRLDDGALATLAGDYLRQQVHLGYAVTVHAAQGVTADTTHAVLAETASRNLAYVALTRGRESNHAYLYHRDSAEADHTHGHDRAAGGETAGMHLARRGTPTHAARALRQVIGRDEPARTAHQIAADTPTQDLPERVASLVAEHQHTLTRRRSTYQKTQRAQQDRALNRHLGLDRSQHREQESGYDLSL